MRYRSVDGVIRSSSGDRRCSVRCLDCHKELNVSGGSGTLDTRRGPV